MNTTTTDLDPARLKKRLRDARYRWRKYIERTNAAFLAASPAEKRVTIAKDVLAALDAKRLTAAVGNYGYFEPTRKFRGEEYTNAWYADRKEFLDGDAREAILNGDISCQACAIGSVFTCAVARMNEVTIEEMQSAEKEGMLDYVKEFFTAEQLDLIECAFEVVSVHARALHRLGDEGTARAAQAVAFGTEVTNAWLNDARPGKSRFNNRAEVRMVAIMENIIANKGEFIP
jgi:hypothetical protein